MSEFVNYNKRDVQLPLGCKDLMDVLSLPAKQGRLWTGLVAADSTSKNVAFTPPPIETGTVRDLGKKICQLLAMPATSRVLGIFTPGSSLYLGCRTDHAPFELLLALSREDNAREQAIRNFFKARKIIPALDFADNETSLRTLLYSLHADGMTVVVLLAELLETAYGVSENTSLDFLLNTSFVLPEY
jgi:hypothetical protein